MMNNVIDELTWRGLIKETTDGLVDLVSSEKITLYNGFDPTGDSLHIGHLVPLMALARFQRFGHTPIALAGGGTGMIGDPSGKSNERQLLTVEQIEANVAKMKLQLAHLLDFEIKSNPAMLLNNIDWLGKLSTFDFLRNVGKHFTVNYMMAKESVKARITRDQGISYTEFSYMLLQSYDFLYLFDHYGCKVQAGGTDQWGNITAGTELIRKVRGAGAQALAYPLITRADGTKFGKTADGQSVWLDAQKTSPFRFYQFWVNTGDGDVINYLKYFTWLGRTEIEQLQAEIAVSPETRSAQYALARAMTAMIHGVDGLANAEKASAALFGGSIDGLSGAEIEDIFADVPRAEIAKELVLGDGINLTDLLSIAQVCSSKGEAKRLIENGGISINNQRIDDAKQSIGLNVFIEGKYLVIRRGKKNYHLVKLVG